jgi:hypothetical protein
MPNSPGQACGTAKTFDKSVFYSGDMRLRFFPLIGTRVLLGSHFLSIPRGFADPSCDIQIPSNDNKRSPGVNAGAKIDRVTP